MFWRRRRERDLEREIQSHLELEAEEHDGDQSAARRAFGNRMRIQEDTRAAWGWAGCEQFCRDLRLAVSTLRRRPVLAGVAIVSLAIAIGANTTVFSFANAILIRTLPVRNPRELVILRQHNEASRMEKCCLQEAVIRQLALKDFGFEDLVGVSDDNVQFRVGGQSERLVAEFVTPNYFSMLGVGPAAGRMFDANDDGPGAAVVVISYDLWAERFGARADAVGQQIEIEGMPFQIVGVAARGFAGLSLNTPRDMQIPTSMMKVLDKGNPLEGVGRLRRGVSEEHVLARLNMVGKAVQREAGERVSDRDDFRFLDGSQGLRSGKEEFRRPVLILGLLVGLVLLVTCTNLTALLLVRSVEGSHEAGTRVALGASRLALFRQFLVESLLLAGIGGAAAWGITLLLIRLLSGHITAEGGSLPTNVHPDIVVFAFSVAITLAAALLFGTWPAWKASQVRPLSLVRGAIGGSRRGPLVSRGIVCAQLALSLALLFCGGLFIRTLSNLRSIDLGFSPENLIFLQPRLEGTAHDGRGAGPFFEDVLRRAESLPAIRAASLGVFSPLSGSTLGAPVSIEGYGSPGQPAPRALMHYVSSNYFRTMGVPLLSGEDFPPGMSRDNPGSVIINEEFGRRYFGGAPLGKTFKVGNSERRVIGVVGTTKYRSMREEPEPIFYQPLGGIAPKVLLVRTTGDSTQRILELRGLIQTIDSSVAIDSIVTMEEQLNGILGRERLLAFLSTLLSGAALGLSAIGLYGVLAFSVARRTREIGVRMAVGATRYGVVAMFLREAAWLVIVGVMLGFPLALACGRAAQSLLFGLPSQDIGTIVTATILLLAVAAAAAVIPALRAARLNVVRALRYE